MRLEGKMKKIEKAGVATSLLNPFPMIEIKGTRFHNQRPSLLVCDANIKHNHK